MPFKKVIGEPARGLGYNFERPSRGKEVEPRLLECLV